MRDFAADFSRHVVKKFWKILASSIWRGLFDVRLLNQCVKTCLRTKRRFLRFARNLRPHCFGEGNRVEHFSNFWRFCSTFGAARPVFDESGSQKPDFPLCSHHFLIILPSALDFSRKGFFKAPLAAFRPGFFRMTNTVSKA